MLCIYCKSQNLEYRDTVKFNIKTYSDDESPPKIKQLSRKYKNQIAFQCIVCKRYSLKLK